MGQKAFPAMSLLLENGTTYTLPTVNAPATGALLVDAGPHPTIANTRVFAWASPATAGGSNGNLQYNNGGAFAGLSGSSISGSDLTLGGKLTLPLGSSVEFGTSAAHPKLRSFAGTRLEVVRYDGTGYIDLWANNLASLTDVISNENVEAGLDVIVGQNVEMVAASELRFGTVGKIRQSSNILYLQSASGATFRDMAGTGYVSATAQSFSAQDYVQGMQRVLVGNTSGGRLLPITDGVRIMNWAQSADGAIQASAGTFSGNLSAIIATFSGHVTSNYQTLSANPTVTDLPVGSARIIRNSSSGITALWINQTGTPEIAQSNGLSTVAVDGLTITGNGTPGSPLVASGGGGGGSSSIPTLMAW